MAKNIDTARAFITAANSIVQALGEANPREDEFEELLHRHERLCRNALNYMDLQERVSFFLSEMAGIEDESHPDNTTIVHFSERVASPTVVDEHDEPVEDFPAPDENPYPDEKEPTVGYTFDEVKEAFTNAAKDGVQVKPIITDMGYEKLSAVPAEKYPALMEQLDLAIKEKA